MRIFTTIRRVVTGAAGSGSGFIASVVNAAIQTTLQVRLVGSTVNTGFQFVVNQFTHRHDISPALATSLLSASGSTQVDVNEAFMLSPSPTDLGVGVVNEGIMTEAFLKEHQGTLVNEALATSLLGGSGSAALPEAKEAFAFSEIPPDLGKPPVNEAVEVVQIKYDLTRRIGANVSTEYAVLGRTDFDATTNTTGLHDGAQNLVTANALGARSGGLRLEYESPVDKTELTIVQVKLHFYTRLGSTAGAKTMRHQWRKASSGAWTTLATRTAVVDYFTTPDTFDITASISSWADIDAIEASVEAEMALGVGSIQCDAVELEVIATATQIV